MKTLINILCVTLAITFVSVEVQANIFSALSKAAKIAGKAGKIAGKGALEGSVGAIKGGRDVNISKHVERIIEFVGKTTREKKRCTFHNENINKEDYYNSLLEQLPKEDNENTDSDETLSSDTKELKLDDEIEENNKSRLTSKKELGCKWENSRCRCFQNKRILKISEGLPKNKLKGFGIISETLKQKVEEDESDQ